MEGVKMNKVAVGFAVVCCWITGLACGTILFLEEHPVAGIFVVIVGGCAGLKSEE